MRVLLGGSTGLIGNAVIGLAPSAGIELVGVGRRATGKLAQELVTRFTDIPPLPAADAAICALGTTLRNAGSRDAFRAVDYEAVIAFARAAQTAGVSRFAVVTAVGANAGSKVFYSRVKGDTEDALTRLGFSRLDIVRPGLLIGQRSERRPVESLLQALSPAMDAFMLGPWRDYRSVTAEAVAACLLGLSKLTAPGIFVHHHNEIMAIAAQSDAMSHQAKRSR